MRLSSREPAHPKNWIQKAVPQSHKGNLHRALGVPLGQRIPAGRVEAATRSRNQRVRRMAVLAQTFARFRH